HRYETFRGEAVEPVAVEREREPARVADPVAEAGAAHPGRALHVEAPELEALLGPGRLRRLADDSLDAYVVLGRAVGDVVRGRIRDPEADLISCGLRLAELLLGALQLLLDAAQLLELLGRRLALELGA